MKRLFACLALCLAFLVAMPAMATIIIGNPPDPGAGNEFPWGFTYNAEYQQVYQASDFNAPITITNLEFFNTQSNSNSTSLPSGDWVIKLSTTPVGVGTMNSLFGLNFGTTTVTVFNGNIFQAWTFGDTLHIPLAVPFTYDPSQGNLLMDVTGFGITIPGGETFFDVHSPGLLFQRVYCSNGVGCTFGIVDTPGYGLVTGFSTVPEPGSLMLLGSGLIGVVGIMRRKFMF